MLTSGYYLLTRKSFVHLCTKSRVTFLLWRGHLCKQWKVTEVVCHWCWLLSYGIACFSTSASMRVWFRSTKFYSFLIPKIVDPHSSISIGFFWYTNLGERAAYCENGVQKHEFAENQANYQTVDGSCKRDAPGRQDESKVNNGEWRFLKCHDSTI